MVIQFCFRTLEENSREVNLYCWKLPIVQQAEFLCPICTLIVNKWLTFFKVMKQNSFHLGKIGLGGGGKVEMSNCPNGLPDLIASRAFVNNNDG